MARSRPAARFGEIVEAAAQVFLVKGYRGARMADVAEQAGVSPGLLYSYAADKESLYHLVIQRELGVDIDETELPVPKSDTDTLAKLTRRAMREVVSITAL
jgi:AcrR family transcriptional regulator